MNFISGFVFILEISTIYFVLGLAFLTLFPQKRIKDYIPLSLVFGYSISFFGALLSKYLGSKPETVVLIFVILITCLLIYSLFSQKFLVIFKNLLKPRNVILLLLFFIASGILLYIPYKHTGNLAPYSHGNNDPWFFVSRAWFLSNNSYHQVPDNIVQGQPVISGIALHHFFPITAYQLGLLSNILSTDPFWLFNSFRIFLQSMSIFGMYYLFRKYFKLSFLVSTIGSFLFIFHPYNIYIFYQGFLKQMFGHPGFVVYPLIIGQVIKDKRWPLIITLIGFLIYAYHYKASLVILIFFGLIFAAIHLFETCFKSKDRNLTKLIKKHWKYLIVSLPLLFFSVYKFLVSYAYLGNFRNNKSEIGYLFPGVFEILGITAFRNPFFKFPPSQFSYLILIVFILLIGYLVYFVKKNKNFNRPFLFLIIGIVFVLLSVPYVYSISNLNTKFLAFRFYSFISPLIFLIFFSPLLLVKKLRIKNLILIGLTVVLVVGYLNGVYNQFYLRGKPDLTLDNQDIQLLNSVNSQCMNASNKIDIGLGGYWDQLWSTYLLRDCLVSLTMPTKKHIIHPEFNLLNHTFAPQNQSDYELIYKLEENYYPSYKSGKKFQLVNLTEAEKLLVFPGNTYGAEFGMFKKTNPFFWLGNKGKYFLKLYSPKEQMESVMINVQPRHSGTLEGKLKGSGKNLFSRRFNNSDEVNLPVELNLNKGWNYLVIDNKVQCSQPENDDRCLSAAIQIEE